ASSSRCRRGGPDGRRCVPRRPRSVPSRRGCAADRRAGAPSSSPSRSRLESYRTDEASRKPGACVKRLRRRAAFEDVLHRLEVAPELTLGDTADDRLRELEEAAGLALADERQPGAAVPRLQPLADGERNRARQHLQVEPLPGLVL